MAFATVAEYRAKYATDLDDAKLGAWLEDASGMMVDEMDAAGVDYYEPTDSMAARLMRICRDCVHRAIGDGTDAAMSIPYGASQASMAAGGYSESFTMGNPYGDLFLKASERKALGIMSGRFAVAAPSYGRAEVPND